MLIRCKITSVCFNYLTKYYPYFFNCKSISNSISGTPFNVPKTVSRVRPLDLSWELWLHRDIKTLYSMNITRSSIRLAFIFCMWCTCDCFCSNDTNVKSNNSVMILYKPIWFKKIHFLMNYNCVIVLMLTYVFFLFLICVE